MRRLIIAALALAGIAGLGAGSLAMHRAGPADEQQAAKQADQNFISTLAKGDVKPLGGLLDRRFSWIDRDGKTYARRDWLRDPSRLAAASGPETEVETRFYGRMLTVRGTHGDARFLRVIVKRRQGWKTILVMETPVAAAQEQASVERSAGPGDCDNPCRTVPYVPKRQMDKDILAAWQKTKMLEWKPDAAQWASFIADEFMIINNSTVRNKQERVAIAQRQQDAGLGTPGDPVTAMRIFDFGSNSALMISQHVPYRGGRPYTNARIWIMRDNRWQLALSQQVTIQSAGPLAAVAGRQ
jgi:Domain of unknown function (DUF4440)